MRVSWPILPILDETTTQQKSEFEDEEDEQERRSKKSTSKQKPVKKKFDYTKQVEYFCPTHVTVTNFIQKQFTSVESDRTLLCW